MKECAVIIRNNINKLESLLKYYNVYTSNNKFFYDYYSITPNVLSIDVKSFNYNFLRFINAIIKNSELDNFIQHLNSVDKHTRVVKFGLLFRELTNLNINIKDYMLGFRNLLLWNFINLYSYSEKSIALYRINYDDIEFSTLMGIPDLTTFVDGKYHNIIKYNKIDYVITLNKSDGVFYVKDNKIIDIKYTGGWVNIPIYKLLLNEIILYLIEGTYSIQQLNIKLFEILEYTSNDKMFGYEDCKFSNRFSPTDEVPLKLKSFFIANIMSKFGLLFNRI